LDKRKYYKYLFIIGAIYAWLAAGSAYIMSYFGTPAFLYESMIYYQGFMFAVIIFGIGYLIVGLNIDQNHGIVLMGIIGKLLVFVFFTIHYINGAIASLQLIIAIGDLIYAILFIEFLLNFKKL
jgi:hypothetical protein